MKRRVRVGDIWVLGRHRLMCGDSTNRQDVDRLMGRRRASLCFTSPPYAQQRVYRDRATKLVQDWDELMRGVFANLRLTPAGQVVVNLGLIHRKGLVIQYWSSWLEWMAGQGWRLFGWYIWDKGSGLPGDWCGRFAPAHEFLFHFNRTSLKPVKFIAKKPASIQVSRGSMLRKVDGSKVAVRSPESSLQPNKLPDSVVRLTRAHSSHEKWDHPAVFPPSLPKFFMQAWPGLAYEPFVGSGSSILAAEELGRTCCAMEISPAYCEIAIGRWEAKTGKAARVLRRTAEHP